MTCVVAVKQENTIVLGCDSAASVGTKITHRKDKKIFKKKDLYFGFAGSFRVGQVIKHQLKISKKPENVSDEEYIVNFIISEIITLLKSQGLVKNNQMDSNLLIVFNNTIFKIDIDFQMELSDDPFTAIGDGEELALGAFYALHQWELTPLERATKALEASARYCSSVAAPFHFKTISFT